MQFGKTSCRIHWSCPTPVWPFVCAACDKGNKLLLANEWGNQVHHEVVRRGDIIVTKRTNKRSAKHLKLEVPFLDFALLDVTKGKVCHWPRVPAMQCQCQLNLTQISAICHNKTVDWQKGFEGLKCEGKQLSRNLLKFALEEHPFLNETMD